MVHSEAPVEPFHVSRSAMDSRRYNPYRKSSTCEPAYLSSGSEPSRVHRVLMSACWQLCPVDECCQGTCFAHPYPSFPRGPHSHIASRSAARPFRRRSFLRYIVARRASMPGFSRHTLLRNCRCLGLIPGQLARDRVCPDYHLSHSADFSFSTPNRKALR